MASLRRRWPLFVIPALLAVAAAVALWLLTPHLPRPVATALGPAPTGSLNILVIGRDARALGPVVNEGRQRNPREPRSHSDVVIIVHVEFDLGRLALVALPRDLLVSVPGVTGDTARTDFGRMDKLTHVHAIGGPGLLRRAVEELLGITIHRHVAFDFDSFRMTIGLLRPFLAGLTVEGVPMADRGRALKLARRRLGLHEDDLDRARNNLHIVRAVVDRTWRLAGTRLGAIVARRLLDIIGPDTDVTADELTLITWGLRTSGFTPAALRSALLVSEGADVLLERYGTVLSCYLPAYDEIQRQVERFLKDRDDVVALDFMSRQDYPMPSYMFKHAPDTVPVDTVADSTALLTRLEEMRLLGTDGSSGVSDSLPADSGR